MANIQEFDAAPMSRRDFWLATFPVFVGIILLTFIVVLWRRPWAVRLRSGPEAAIEAKWRLVGEIWCRFRRGTTGDVEKGSPNAGNPQEERIPNGSPNPAGSLHTDGKGATTVDESPTTLPLTPTCQNTKV